MSLIAYSNFCGNANFELLKEVKHTCKIKTEVYTDLLFPRGIRSYAEILQLFE